MNLNNNRKGILITGIFVFSLIISLISLTFSQEQTKINFDIESPKTWHLNWDKIKQELKVNSNNVNVIWAQISPQDRQIAIQNLIKEKYGVIEVIGFDSSRKITFNNYDFYEPNLKFTKEGLLTNGKAFLNIEKLPDDLKKIEYSEKEKAFIHEFNDRAILTIRTGILNKDLTITGTLWPSDGLKWNKKGEFKQTDRGVEVKKNAKIELKSNSGILTVTSKNDNGFVNFLKGKQGNKWIEGKNIEVFIKDKDGKDFTRIVIPDKKTQVFFGDANAQNQYVRLAENGEEIKIIGEDIEIEVFKDLKKIEVDGEKISVKNKNLFYEFKNDKEGKAQTYIKHKPEDGKNVKIINIRNKDGNILSLENSDSGNVKTESGNGRVSYDNDQLQPLAPQITAHTNPLSSSVRVRQSLGRHDNLGTGTYIGKDKEGNGIFITAGHVLDNRGKIQLETVNRKQMPAELIHRESNTNYRDLALLRVPKKYIEKSGIIPTPIASYNLKVGAPVLRIGCKGGGAFTETPCNILTINRYNQGRDITADRLAVQGESGGPLFYKGKDGELRLVGVLSATEIYGERYGESFYASTIATREYLKERGYEYLIQIIFVFFRY